ncbi:hypothetical protein ABEP00_00555 [Heyndrickxia sporothermodurans]
MINQKISSILTNLSNRFCGDEKYIRERTFALSFFFFEAVKKIILS